MITREEAHTSCLSRDCSCINGKDRDCNYHETIDKIYDEFEQHIKSLEAQLNTEQLACEWKLENDEMNSYRSSCSYVFYLEEGTPKMNDMNFCPKCGKKITSKDTR